MLDLTFEDAFKIIESGESIDSKKAREIIQVLRQNATRLYEKPDTQKEAMEIIKIAKNFELRTFPKEKVQWKEKFGIIDSGFFKESPSSPEHDFIQIKGFTVASSVLLLGENKAVRRMNALLLAYETDKSDERSCGMKNIVISPNFSLTAKSKRSVAALTNSRNRLDQCCRQEAVRLEFPQKNILVVNLDSQYKGGKFATDCEGKDPLLSPSLLAGPWFEDDDNRIKEFGFRKDNLLESLRNL